MDAQGLEGFGVLGDAGVAQVGGSGDLGSLDVLLGALRCFKAQGAWEGFRFGLLLARGLRTYGFNDI